MYVACDKQHSSGGDGGNGSSGSGNGGPSYFDTKPEPEKTGTDLTKSTKGSKFEHTDDWGERYKDVHATVLCVLDCLTGQVCVCMSTNRAALSVRAACHACHISCILRSILTSSPICRCMPCLCPILKSKASL